MKIDTTKIEGYAEMSAEDKLKALESFEYEDYSKDVERYKNATTKANGEAAEWKRKHNALLDEEQKKQLEIEEHYKAIEEQNKQLLKDKQISDFKAKYLSLGYGEELATATAKALSDGNLEDVFANQKKYLEEHDKLVKADLLSNSPRPASGGTGEITTAEYLKKAEECMANGDYANASYYTRKAQTIGN